MLALTGYSEAHARVGSPPVEFIMRLSWREKRQSEDCRLVDLHCAMMIKNGMMNKKVIVWLTQDK